MKKKNIAIIEDDRNHSELVKFILEEAGYEVYMATTGMDLLEQIVEDVPDLFIIDLSVPLASGDEVMEVFRTQDLFKDVPIIVVSSKTEDEIEAAANKIGAKGWMRKPIEKGKFLELVRNNVK